MSSQRLILLALLACGASAQGASSSGPPLTDWDSGLVTFYGATGRRMSGAGAHGCTPAAPSGALPPPLGPHRVQHARWRGMRAPSKLLPMVPPRDRRPPPRCAAGGSPDGMDPASPSYGTKEGSCGYGTIPTNSYPWFRAGALR